MEMPELDRVEAKRLIMEDDNSEGTYLVRKKDTGQIILSCAVDADKIRHFEIKQEDSKFVSSTGLMFDTLYELVHHFKTNLTHGEGIPCQLRHAIRTFVDKLPMSQGSSF